MARDSMDILELLRKRGMDGDVDFLREALAVLVEGIMDAEVSAKAGAGYGERSPDRVTQRNGYRSRAWDTRVGTMELRIPKLRDGSYFPSLLEPRRRSEKALLAVIQQAYVEGVSTRRVDDLVKALGCEGISKSQVSRICKGLDEVVEKFLNRPLGRRTVCVLVVGRADAEGQRGWQDSQRERGGGNCGERRGQEGDSRSGRGRERGWRLLVELPALTGGTGAEWRGTGHIGRASGAQGWDSRRVRWSELAALSRALYDQPAESGSKAGAALGGDDGAQHLPAAFCRRGSLSAREGSRADPGALPAGCGDVGRSRSGDACLHELPDGALEEYLVEQSAGEAEQGDTATDRCGGHLPEPIRGATAGRSSTRRAER